MSDAVSAKSDLSRVPSIDALRGIAVLLVVVHHFVSTPPLLVVADFGRVGVLLFFLLSGYCISISLAAPGNRSVFSFLIRRVFRLYPLYWLSIAAAAVFMGQSVAPLDYLANITMLQTAFRVPDVLGVYWTLFIELVFYVFVAGLLLFGISRSVRVHVILLVMLSVCALAASIVRSGIGIAVPFAYFLFLSLFVLGSLAALIDLLGQERPTLFYVGLAAYLGVIGVVSLLVFGDRVIGSESGLNHFGNYLCAVSLFAVFSRPFPLRFGLLAYIGTISYGIYLFHTIVLSSLDQPAWQDSQQWIVGSTLFALITFGVAACFHHLLEAPMIRLAKRLTTRRAGEPTPGNATRVTETG